MKKLCSWWSPLNLTEDRKTDCVTWPCLPDSRKGVKFGVGHIAAGGQTCKVKYVAARLKSRSIPAARKTVDGGAIKNSNIPLDDDRFRDEKFFGAASIGGRRRFIIFYERERRPDYLFSADDGISFIL
ncbi:hypothetical protein EVAR_38001_1 [Eumeta japonica]|uniref:Uncharacterized protein n=1 Tax=Eumeta variegata TaxID=151549 RepID=A0A4C1WUX1_EUMVA|nr:hypothetical protein EVAR_38001_1 [Eumeta japonica]